MFAQATRSLKTMTIPPRPRRFAPLDPAKWREDEKRPVLQGIVFDLDGTLCLPQNYMFAEMRAALGIEKPTDILDHINSLPKAEREEAHDKICDIELTAMESQQAQAGLVELMEYLESRGVRKSICTRNFEAPVANLLTRFLPDSKFAPIVTRKFKPPKPDPAGIMYIAKAWSHEDGSGLIMVGDSIDDMTAGYHAGAATVLLANSENQHLVQHKYTDFVIEQLDELIQVLDNGFEGSSDAGEK